MLYIFKQKLDRLAKLFVTFFQIIDLLVAACDVVIHYAGVNRFHEELSFVFLDL